MKTSVELCDYLIQKAKFVSKPFNSWNNLHISILLEENKTILKRAVEHLKLSLEHGQFFLKLYFFSIISRIANHFRFRTTTNPRVLTKIFQHHLLILRNKKHIQSIKMLRVLEAWKCNWLGCIKFCLYSTIPQKENKRRQQITLYL